MTDLLKPRYEAIAARLKKAVLEHRPIIIRHHGDTDGISAGIIMEKVLSGLIPDKGKKIDRYIIRKPTHTPYYDTQDCLRDINLIARFMLPKDQNPLLLLLDIGSTAEDLLAVNLFKSFGFETIIVDHHPPYDLMDTDLCHCNPHLVKLQNITTSMMAYEIAKLIDGFDEVVWAALGGVGDKTYNDDYIKASGKTKTELRDLKICVDYLGYKMHEAGTYIYEQVLGNPKVKESLLKNLDIDNKIENLMDSVKIEENTNYKLVHVDLEGRGFEYPSPGKTCGFLFDRLDTGKDFVLLGFFKDSVIIRQTKPLFKIDILKAKINQVATVEGGGHDVAGTLKYNGIDESDILRFVKELLNYRVPAST